jgi:hypothetical protein
MAQATLPELLTNEFPTIVTSLFASGMSDVMEITPNCVAWFLLNVLNLTDAVELKKPSTIMFCTNNSIIPIFSVAETHVVVMRYSLPTNALDSQ